MRHGMLGDDENTADMMPMEEQHGDMGQEASHADMVSEIKMHLRAVMRLLMKMESSQQE